MPILKIFTNIPKSRIPKDFLVKIISVLVDSVRKEADKFICMIESDCLLTIEGNSTLAAACATLESIGNLGPEDNIRIAKLLSNFMEKELAVTPDRFLLTFYDLKSYNVAKGGTTIANLLEI